MTKTERIDRIAERVQLPKYQTEAVVTSVLQFIMDALRPGDKVELRGFGSFRLHCRQSRVGRNPQTGDTVQIPPKQVPWFTAGKALRVLGNQPDRDGWIVNSVSSKESGERHRHDAGRL